MYQYYGTIVYNHETIQDITTRFILKPKSNGFGITSFLEYLIKDWESPENIAYKLYGSCEYVWVILLCNDIINPFTDWLLTNEELEELIAQKYGDKANAVHHYELNGIVYTEKMPNAIVVTNAQYEYDKNEKKRKIKVLPANVIPTIEEAMKKV